MGAAVGLAVTVVIGLVVWRVLMWVLDRFL